MDSCQTGIHSNLRLLFNIIYNKQDTGACLISLDAQRAFDQTEWPYLFSSLKEFGFGDHFLRWVKILYAKTEDSVITNQTESDSFRLHRGTRQGCLLSPYLFAIVMEPLAISIRQSPYIAPISIEGRQQHIRYMQMMFFCLQLTQRPQFPLY